MTTDPRVRTPEPADQHTPHRRSAPPGPRIIAPNRENPDQIAGGTPCLLGVSAHA